MAEADLRASLRLTRPGDDLVTMSSRGIAGAIAWFREANPSIGEYGEPKALFVGGDVPDMEWGARPSLRPSTCASRPTMLPIANRTIVLHGLDLCEWLNSTPAPAYG